LYLRGNKILSDYKRNYNYYKHTIRREIMNSSFSKKRPQKEIMIEYLVKNNRKNVQEYILGYKTVKDILKETGLPRYAFYTAINNLNTNIHKYRREHKMEILSSIHKQIMRCITYEYIKFEPKQLFGRNSSFENFKIDKQKGILDNLLDINGFDIADMHFISLSRIFSWYKRYCVRKDLKKGAETGYQIGNKYNINKSTVYIIKREMKENKPLLSGTSDKQENILLENIEISYKYKNGETIQDLSETYHIEEWLLKILLESMEYVERTIENIVNSNN